jgi:NADH-quinone oxidoreductase subunit M
VTLPWLLIAPFAGAFLAWASEGLGERWPRLVSLVSLAALLALTLLARGGAAAPLPGGHPWLAETSLPWIPAIGARFHLALDGISLVLILLTAVLGAAAVLSSWTEVRERVGFFHFNLMAIAGGIVGVFLSMDLLLFYFFWEVMLIPMYFLIAIWGHENRAYAAVKFFLFTQGGSLLMLVSILFLSFLRYRHAGSFSFDYPDLMAVPLRPSAAMWLFLGFFIAFAVKLPMVPLHTWLPDAHTEAPTAGSVILAGLLLKTGAYGLIRFAVPLFPGAAREFAPAAMALGVAGILYGAFLAFAQSDVKRLVAYTSVSHLGFVLLGIFAWNEAALQGAVMEMVCHGLSTGALFILAGAIQERIHTRDMDRMGGIWAVAPRFSGAALFFALASLGMPGLGNFVAEFLVLSGAYRENVPAASVATVGFVFAAVYALALVQKVFHGPRKGPRPFPDLSAREAAVMAVLILLLVWLGTGPQSLLDAARPAIGGLQGQAGRLVALLGG